MRPEVAACFDEIEAARRIIKDKSNNGSKSKARTWIQKQKKLLESMNYKGKI